MFKLIHTGTRLCSNSFIPVHYDAQLITSVYSGSLMFPAMVLSLIYVIDMWLADLTHLVR